MTSVMKYSAVEIKTLPAAANDAIIAATCSLPEAIGGERNWDYRYSWIRDSAFTLYALLRLGLWKESEAYVNFLASLGPGSTCSDASL